MDGDVSFVRTNNERKERHNPLPTYMHAKDELIPYTYIGQLILMCTM